jgi:hypothetical protein
MENKMVAAESLLEKVRATKGTAELCDASGTTVALLVPPDYFKEMFLAWADRQLTPEMMEENRRAVAEGRVLTTTQVLDRLADLDHARGGGARPTGSSGRSRCSSGLRSNTSEPVPLV